MRYARSTVRRGGKNVTFTRDLCCVQVKVSSPDYANMNKEEVLADFMLRIEHYQERYRPLDENHESDLSFMKIYNTGEKVLVHKHEGHIQSRIVYYLMNIHIVPRTIYLTRHGESLMNLDSRIGGDSDLSDRGREYAKALANFITSQDIQVYPLVCDCFFFFFLRQIDIGLMRVSLRQRARVNYLT